MTLYHHCNIILVHLAGIEPVRVASLDPKSSASASSAIGAWCRLSESNQQPDDYKSTALPIELRRHLLNACLFYKKLFLNTTIYLKSLLLKTNVPKA